MLLTWTNQISEWLLHCPPLVSTLGMFWLAGVMVADHRCYYFFLLLIPILEKQVESRTVIQQSAGSRTSNHLLFLSALSLVMSQGTLHIFHLERKHTHCYKQSVSTRSAAKGLLWFILERFFVPLNAAALFTLKLLKILSGILQFVYSLVYLCCLCCLFFLYMVGLRFVSTSTYWLENTQIWFNNRSY